MSDQLWTSAVTGYRRRGTRVADMRMVVGAGVTARAIYEPLQSCPASAPAVELRAALELRDFDVAGVRETKSGELLGIVRRDELAGGLVRDHVRPIGVERLLAESTDLGELFGALQTHEQVFVLVGRGIEGIITRTDLNKPPIRVYLFGLVSLFEMHLGYWIRDAYPDATWEHALAPQRLQAAKERLKERLRWTSASTLISCLQFCDKRDLLLKKPDVLATLNLGSKGESSRFLRAVERMRDDLAHSQATLTASSSWTDIIGLAIQIEETVHHSDLEIERRAKAGAVIDATLWET